MTKLLAFRTSEWTRFVLFHSHAKISEINCRRKLETIERQYVCICVVLESRTKEIRFTVNDILRVHVSNDFFLRQVFEVRSFNNSFCEIHRFVGRDVNWDVSQSSDFCNCADCFDELVSSRKYPLERRVTFASLLSAAESSN